MGCWAPYPAYFLFGFFSCGFLGFRPYPLSDPQPLSKRCATEICSVSVCRQAPFGPFFFRHHKSYSTLYFFPLTTIPTEPLFIFSFQTPCDILAQPPFPHDYQLILFSLFTLVCFPFPFSSCGSLLYLRSLTSLFRLSFLARRSELSLFPYSVPWIPGLIHSFWGLWVVAPHRGPTLKINHVLLAYPRFPMFHGFWNFPQGLF